MIIHKQITDTKINPNTSPTNIKITPVNITVPKVFPKRDDKVSLA